MALTGWSAANYLIRSTAVVTAYPYFLSIWGTSNAAGTPNTAIFIGQSTDTPRHAFISATGTPRINLSSHDGTTNVGIEATVNYPTDSSWFHMTGELIGTSERAVLFNGANRAQILTTTTPAAPNRVLIGARPDPGIVNPWFNTQGLAEASIWDGTGMTAANMDALALKLRPAGYPTTPGGNPLNITAEVGQPWTGKLVTYVLDSANSLTDLTGNGHNFTMVGTLTNFGSHPTIDAVSSGGQARRTMQQLRMRSQ